MPKQFEEISSRVISSAITVHKTLGSGFLESIYQNALEIQLFDDKINFEKQKQINIYFHEILVGTHVIDLLINNEMVIELKAVKELTNFHIAQVISYLKATGLKVALILNFSKSVLEIKRIVN